MTPYPPLPDLPGIDPAIGLSYSAGNPGIYLRMLGRFRAAKGGAARELREALAAGNLETAARIAHTLKSAALAIGAVPLSEAARDLEPALGGPSQDALLDTFESRLRLVVEGLGVL